MRFRIVKEYSGHRLDVYDRTLKDWICIQDLIKTAEQAEELAAKYQAEMYPKIVKEFKL